MTIQLIAEIGSVHDGSFGNAAKLIEAAASAGATAVKFQTHIGDAETLADAPMPPYFKGESRIEYFRRTAFSLDQWKELKKVADRCNVVFLSSPFAIEAVDILETLNVLYYKIPSGEVTNLPLLERVAETKKPILLSSGMSSWSELDKAVEVCSKNNDLTILQCTSAYPTPPSLVGLHVLQEMKNRYGLPVGLSDHTMGNTAAIAAATLGAIVIEKHFAFSRLMYGSDAQHSSEPDEFKKLAEALKELSIMLSSKVDKNEFSEMTELKIIFEKSIVSKRPLVKGTVLTFEDFAFKKPGNGISAARSQELIGRVLKKDVPKDYKFVLKDFE